MKKTNYDKNLKQFIDEIALSWFKNNLSIKIEKLKKDFLEISNGGFGEFNPLSDENAAISIKPQVIDNVYKDFQIRVSEWKTIEDINSYSIDSQNIFDLSKIFSNQNTEIGTDIVQDLIENQVDIGELIVKVQIETIIKMLANSLEIMNDLVNKLGPTTTLQSIDLEDLDYILKLSIKKSVDNFEKWINSNYKELENFKEEFLILKDDKKDLEIRLEKADVINIFFKQFKSKEIAKDIESIDLNNDAGVSQNTAEKFINFTNGAQIAGDIKNRIKIAILIKESF
ncbi:hypothetical protein [Spiroplasma alleghenense]|uniref:Uncharacterized protein n=1 Tax=Spiroplasma alleghenense TaxID=216931 RepID=A0A345Z3L2_9MOLU|nr:hypothetical protein [Spiroplasma alleghenense]AXK51191.1 hypothetical protein SALLE_v1c05170 [Spiroplasma alleghenense]